MTFDASDMAKEAKLADSGYKPEIAELVRKLIAVIQALETRVAALEKR